MAEDLNGGTFRNAALIPNNGIGSEGRWADGADGSEMGADGRMSMIGEMESGGRPLGDHPPVGLRMRDHPLTILCG